MQRAGGRVRTARAGAGAEEVDEGWQGSGSLSSVGPAAQTSWTSRLPPLASALRVGVRGPASPTALFSPPPRQQGAGHGGLAASSACQLVQWEGDVKHCRHCGRGLGKLSPPQFTLLSGIP